MFLSSGVIADVTAQIFKLVGSAVGLIGGKFTDLYCFTPEADVPVHILIAMVLLSGVSNTDIAKSPLSC